MSPTAQPSFGIVGLGLVGGSIAKALRAAFPSAEIVAVEPDNKTRDKALRSGVVSRANGDLHNTDSLDGCTVLFVCVPLGAYPEIFALLGERLTKPVITDVAGVKGVVERWAAEHLGELAFVGGHPMAGGEVGGYDNARGDLFRGIPVALCPRADDDSGHAATLAQLWRTLGASPAVMSAPVHDAIVARTSHLPYLAAVAQIQLMRDAPDRRSLMGRGFENSTRHAAFDPDVMATVVSHNPEAAQAARDLAATLTELADLAERDPRGLRARAQEARELVRKLIG